MRATVSPIATTEDQGQVLLFALLTIRLRQKARPGPIFRPHFHAFAIVKYVGLMRGWPVMQLDNALL